MSPEQANSHPLDERADVFSMGALLYEMMVGRPPYQARTAMDALILARGEFALPTATSRCRSRASWCAS